MSVGQIGSKAGNLLELQRLGCRVPAFIALSNEEIGRLCQKGKMISLKEDELDSLKERIQQEIPGSRYAVRSAALIEDQAASSLAGQFKTCLDLGLEDIPRALEEVLTHAYQYLEGDLLKFSLLIQQYIEPDYSGVIFTRHPEGRRQMLLEYHAGRGEELVSGNVTPESVELLWNDAPRVKKLSVFSKVFDQVKAIEMYFGHPQDIEWCVKDDEWFFLQARPITTIDTDQYHGIQYLEEHLPRTNFFYEQTEISEIAPRPVPFMYSLLQVIYQQGGPVDRVYRRLGITYQERDFLKIVGNQLYVDRDEEIKTLFPNYTYLALEALGQPKMVGIKGFLTSIRQQGAFGKLGEIPFESPKQRIQALLDQEIAVSSFDQALREFLEVYETIFEVNLLAEEAVKRAQKQEPTFALESLARSSALTPLIAPPRTSVSWKGNSLDIADQSAFVASLISFRIQTTKPIVERAFQLTQLREQGRWLTVRMVNVLREALFNASGVEKKNVLFSTISEIQKNHVDPKTCSERERMYRAFDGFTFPAELASFCVQKQGEGLLCLSKGEGEGTVVRVDEVDRISGSKILYTETLTPDLVHLFPKVQGILAQRGGVLSHLAILAREHGVPVLSNVDLYKQGMHLGERVRMNADQGKVTRLS